LCARTRASDLACLDPEAEPAMRAAILAAAHAGDTLGGTFEVVATGVPPGLGSHVQWDRKLDGRLAQALMSIHAIKGVEIGLGFEAARVRGSEVHDPIGYDEATRTFPRASNRAGGLEGGITNGMPVVCRAAMKPIATLKKALPSVDVRTKEAFDAAFERSDVCAVPAASVVGEAMVAITLADALLEKLGGDSLREMIDNLASYRRRLAEY
jgi:chorismate synthase